MLYSTLPDNPIFVQGHLAYKETRPLLVLHRALGIALLEGRGIALQGLLAKLLHIHSKLLRTRFKILHLAYKETRPLLVL